MHLVSKPETSTFLFTDLFIAPMNKWRKRTNACCMQIRRKIKKHVAFKKNPVYLQFYTGNRSVVLLVVVECCLESVYQCVLFGVGECFRVHRC